MTPTPKSYADAIVARLIAAGCKSDIAGFVVASIGPADPALAFDYNHFDLFEIGVCQAIDRLNALGGFDLLPPGFDEWAKALKVVSAEDWQMDPALRFDKPKGGGTGFTTWSMTKSVPFYATMSIDVAGPGAAGLRELKTLYLALVAAACPETFDPRRVASSERIEALGVVIRRTKNALNEGSRLLDRIPHSSDTLLHFNRQLASPDLEKDLNDQDLADLAVVRRTTSTLLSRFPTVVPRASHGSRASGEHPRAGGNSESARPTELVARHPRGRPSAEPANAKRNRIWKRSTVTQLAADDTAFPQPGPAEIQATIFETRPTRRILDQPPAKIQDIYVALPAEATGDAGAAPFSAISQRTRNARDALIRQNQYLPTQWGFPTREDLRVLHASLEKPEFESKVGLTADEKAALLFSLYSGRHWAGVVHSAEPWNDAVAVLDLSRRCWSFRLTLPSDRAMPSGSALALLEPVETELVLPLHPRIADNLLGGAGTSLPFANVSAGNMRQWLDELNDYHGSRLSFSTIRNALVGALLRITSDLVEVAHITSDPRFTCSSGLYYYTPTRHRLANVYADAVDWIDSQSPSPALYRIGRLNPDGRVGSALLLRPEALGHLIAHLQGQLTTADRRARNKGKLIEFHNAYTAWVSILIHFGLGHRAVGEPIARWSDIDFRRAMALVSDKDEFHKLSTRLVPLAALVLETLRAYRAHVQALKKRLRQSDSDIVTAWDDDTPTLFYLDTKLNRLADSAANRNPFLGDDRLPEDNVPRHWFRTSVREHGASGELTDCAMGHWLIGQNPSGVSSSLRHVQAAQPVAEAVQAALQRAGFAMIRGCA